MAAAETFDTPEGGIILWGSEPPEGEDNFIVRLRLKDGRLSWSPAWRTEDGEVDYKPAYVEAEIIGYCRGPDVSGPVAYQLSGPGEGMD